MDRLCALGIAIPLDRNLFIHREAYLQLVSQTFKTKKLRDTLEISEAKERTGFSRKFVIPFLNRMERDGYIKRDGGRRVILTLP
jgi:selenocysteine-specific elongation factor